MKKIELYIAPYAKGNDVKTRLIVDGHKINSKDNRLTNLVVYQPMHKWLNPYKKKLFVWNGFLDEIIEEFNDRNIHFVFNGCKSDYTLFKKSILVQQEKLNRNGGLAQVTFENVDTWNPKKAVKELSEILDDLRLEADNWGEDEIIKEIDSVMDDIRYSKVQLKTEFHTSPNEFLTLLQKYNIKVQNNAVLTVIPVKGRTPVFKARDYLAALLRETEDNKKYMIVNTSLKENEVLFDTVISLENGNEASIKYIENDGDDYIQEIDKTYFLYTLPVALRKTVEILHMFPDHQTNSYLIDITNRIADLS